MIKQYYLKNKKNESFVAFIDYDNPYSNIVKFNEDGEGIHTVLLLKTDTLESARKMDISLFENCKSVDEILYRCNEDMIEGSFIFSSEENGAILSFVKTDWSDVILLRDSILKYAVVYYEKANILNVINTKWFDLLQEAYDYWFQEYEKLYSGNTFENWEFDKFFDTCIVTNIQYDKNGSIVSLTPWHRYSVRKHLYNDDDFYEISSWDEPTLSIVGVAKGLLIDEQEEGKSIYNFDEYPYSVYDNLENHYISDGYINTSFLIHHNYFYNDEMIENLSKIPPNTLCCWGFYKEGQPDLYSQSYQEFSTIKQLLTNGLLQEFSNKNNVLSVWILSDELSKVSMVYDYTSNDVI